MSLSRKGAEECAPRLPQEESNEEKLATLVSLGFSPSMSRLGLAEAEDGTVTAALEWMIDHPQLEREDGDQYSFTASHSTSSRRNSSVVPLGGDGGSGRIKEQWHMSARDREARFLEGFGVGQESACSGNDSGSTPRGHGSADQNAPSSSKRSGGGESESESERIATEAAYNRNEDVGAHSTMAFEKIRDGKKGNGLDETASLVRVGGNRDVDPKSSTSYFAEGGGSKGARPEIAAAPGPPISTGQAGRTRGTTHVFDERAVSTTGADFGTLGAHRVPGPVGVGGDDGDGNGGDGEGTVSPLGGGPDNTPGVSVPLPAVAVPEAGRRSSDHQRRGDDRMLQRMIQNAPLVRGHALPKSAEEENTSPYDRCTGKYKRILGFALVSSLIVCAVAIPLALFLPEKGSPVPQSPDTDETVLVETIPTRPERAMNTTNLTTATTTTSSPITIASERFRTMEGILFRNDTTSNSSALEDPSSPQFRALRWLADEDYANIALNDTERLEQRYALAVIFYSSSGNGWGHNLNFLSGEHECDWWDQVCDPNTKGSCHFFFGAYRGVSCNSQDQVVALGLGALGLQGSFPAFEASLLSELQILSLGENSMTGPLDEEAFGNMGQLYLLDLHNNLFTGTLPSLNQLYNLRTLYLWSNLLTGTVGDVFPPYIVEMPMLGNVLTGSLPESLGKLKYATFVSFGKNMLSGSLPLGIKDMWSLEIFDAMGNQLTGTIPSFLGDLPNIKAWGLGHNKFNGTLSPHIFDPPSLVGAAFEANDITGTLPPIESQTFGGLSAHSNKLHGEIPASLGRCSNLMFLDLANNKLTGELPETFRNLERLTWLSLMKNDLSGDLNPFCGISQVTLADCKEPDEEVRPEVSCDCCWCCHDGEQECGLYIDVVAQIWQCLYGDKAADCPIWGFL